MSNLVLASASPRRKELLSLAGFDFEVIVSNVEELIDWTLSAEKIVESLAEQKAKAVSKQNPAKTVIGADTVVVLDGKILGKPKSREQAKQMLASLSGRKHCVYTGVAVCVGGETVKCFSERTAVEFWTLSEEEIDAYVATGECDDKAGAYGIQGKGCTLVKGIEGDYFNVVGFPVSRFCREIVEIAY